MLTSNVFNDVGETAVPVVCAGREMSAEYYVSRALVEARASIFRSTYFRDSTLKWKLSRVLSIARQKRRRERNVDEFRKYDGKTKVLEIMGRSFLLLSFLISAMVC